MKTAYIYAIAALLLALTGAPGCSDNYDSDEVPSQADLVLKVDGHASAFSVNYGAEPESIQVEVESNTLWKVDIECTGGWCTADKLTGKGNESFNLILLENISEERDAKVMVYIVGADGERINMEGKTTSIQMTVRQDVSEVRLSPSSLPPFEAENPVGKEILVSANVAWTLTVNYEEGNSGFLTLTPIEGDVQTASSDSFFGSGQARFMLTAQSNRSEAERKAFISLSGAGDTGNYVMEVAQKKSSYVFDVSPTEPQRIEAVGGSIDFGVLSLTDWEASCASDWITLSPASGTAAGSRVNVTAGISPNTTGFERTAEIHFFPKDKSVDVKVTVTQFGSREPAISEPWLADGFGQNSVTVLFNYFSPFVDVVEAGLQWRREEDADWNSKAGSVSYGIAGTVVVDLSDLVSATRYVARGYVRDADGVVKYGSVSYPFTTAGKYPGSGDNPTPDL